MEARPVPRFVFSLPTFAEKHEALCIAANLDQLPIVERWLTHKDILRETARVALAEHLVLAGASGEGGGLTLASMARAAWFSDIRLVRDLWLDLSWRGTISVFSALGFRFLTMWLSLR